MPDKPPDSGSADPLDIHGVVPPTVTAFDDGGDVDPAATAAHAQFVAARGATGVFPLGTNGEFPLLTGEERREAVDAVATSVDVPVYVYHIPSKTGNALSLETLARIAAIDDVAGLKDSSKDVPWLAQAVDAHPELTFLVGSDSLLFAGLELGCSGLVSAVANVFPELVVDLYDAYDAGDESEARRLQSTVFDVRSALKRGPYMAGVKTALSLRDVEFDVGGLRPPLRAMDESQRTELKTDLQDIGVL